MKRGEPLFSPSLSSPPPSQLLCLLFATCDRWEYVSDTKSILLLLRARRVKQRDQVPSVPPATPPRVTPPIGGRPIMFVLSPSFFRGMTAGVPFNIRTSFIFLVTRLCPFLRRGKVQRGRRYRTGGTQVSFRIPRHPFVLSRFFDSYVI